MAEAQANKTTYQILEDDKLLALWNDHHSVIATLQEYKDHIERELQTRMESRGATAIPSDKFDCKLDFGTPQYDNNLLIPLLELLPKEVIDKAFTPAHEETKWVEDRWDARTFRFWDKYGQAVKGIIEKATMPSRGRLKIKAKE